MYFFPSLGPLRPVPLKLFFFSPQVINFSSGKVGHGHNDFTKRVGFSVTMPSANLSIYINKTQESDSGLYFCHVIVPGGHGISGEMRLNVKGNCPQCQKTFQRYSETVWSRAFFENEKKWCLDNWKCCKVMKLSSKSRWKLYRGVEPPIYFHIECPLP